MIEPISVIHCDSCYFIKRGCDAKLESCPSCTGKFKKINYLSNMDRAVCIPCKIFTTRPDDYGLCIYCKNGHRYTFVKLSEAISMAEQVLAEKSAVDILAKKLNDFKESFELSEKDLVNNDTIVRMKTALSHASILDHFPESSEFKYVEKNMHTFQKNIRKLELVEKIWNLMKEKSYADLEKLFPLVHVMKREIYPNVEEKDETLAPSSPMERGIDILLKDNKFVSLGDLAASSYFVTVTLGKVCACFEISKDTYESRGTIEKKAESETLELAELELAWPPYNGLYIRKTSKDNCRTYHVNIQSLHSLTTKPEKINTEMNNTQAKKSVKDETVDEKDETVDEKDEDDIVVLPMTTMTEDPNVPEDPKDPDEKEEPCS
jgi:hypothetical protein